MSLDFDSIPRAHPLRQSAPSRAPADRSQSARVVPRSQSSRSSRRSKKANPKQSKIQPKTQPYCCCDSGDGGRIVSGKQPQSAKSSRKQNRVSPKLNLDGILRRIGLASASLSKPKKSRSSRRRRNGAKKDSKKAGQPQTNNPYFNQVEYSEQR